MCQVNFKVESKFKPDKRVVVEIPGSGVGSRRAIYIPDNGSGTPVMHKEFSLNTSSGETRFVITVEDTGNGKQRIELGANFYIRLCAPKDLEYTLTKEKDHCVFNLSTTPTPSEELTEDTLTAADPISWPQVQTLTANVEVGDGPPSPIQIIQKPPIQ